MAKQKILNLSLVFFCKVVFFSIEVYCYKPTNVFFFSQLALHDILLHISVQDQLKPDMRNAGAYDNKGRHECMIPDNSDSLR